MVCWGLKKKQNKNSFIVKGTLEFKQQLFNYCGGGGSGKKKKKKRREEKRKRQDVKLSYFSFS